MKCTECNQHAELVVSGWHHPHPKFYCPVCGESYWVHEYRSDGTVVKTFPPRYLQTKTREYYHKKFNYTWRVNKHATD